MQTPIGSGQNAQSYVGRACGCGQAAEVACRIMDWLLPPDPGPVTAAGHPPDGPPAMPAPAPLDPGRLGALGAALAASVGCSPAESRDAGRGRTDGGAGAEVREKLQGEQGRERTEQGGGEETLDTSWSTMEVDDVRGRGVTEGGHGGGCGTAGYAAEAHVQCLAQVRRLIGQRRGQGVGARDVEVCLLAGIDPVRAWALSEGFRWGFGGLACWWSHPAGGQCL
jgi:hypothetical protein